MNSNKLNIYTGSENESGHDFIFLNEDINYVRSKTNVDIAVTDQHINVGIIDDLIKQFNPTIILLHMGLHYSENGNWQDDLKIHKIVESNSKTKFLLLDQHVQTLKKRTENYEEVYYDYIFNYFRKFMIGELPKNLYFTHGVAAQLSSWRATTDEELNVRSRNKVFLSLNKLYIDQGRTVYRKKLFETLYQYKNMGYLSGPGRPENPGVIEKILNWTEPSLHLPAEYEGKDGELLIKNSLPSRWFAPAHHYYYNTSYISIYAETIEYGKIVAPTEKTYVPLWKGHLILPFSTYNFISSLEKLGFKFPKKYINYDYDQIQDNETRWHAYKKELERLINLSLSNWEFIYSNTIEIRAHNKNLFYKKEDYKIKPYLQKWLNKKI